MATKKKKKSVKKKAAREKPVAVKSAKKQPARGKGKPFKRGQSGNPSGRPKGSKSFKTMEVEAIFKDLNYNPLESMVKLAVKKSTPASVQAKLHADLEEFMYPKRKAIEHTGEVQLARPTIYAGQKRPEIK